MREPVFREMCESDLPVLFEIQCDAEGRRMAAFTSTEARGEEIEEVLFRLD